MQKAIFAAVALAVAPAAMAHNTGPGCGLGSQVFEGQSGLAAHIFAATTNGTAANQLFGLTSGTSGCNQNAVVSNEEKRSMFVAGNFDTLARDAAQGEGASLEVLAQLSGIASDDMSEFVALMQSKHSELFSGDSAAMISTLTSAMVTNQKLAKYAA